MLGVVRTTRQVVWGATAVHVWLERTAVIAMVRAEKCLALVSGDHYSIAANIGWLRQGNHDGELCSDRLLGHRNVCG